MTWELVEETPQEKSLEPKFQEKAKEIHSGVVRNLARTGTNLPTFAVGLPGNIFSAINTLAAKPIMKAITGQEGLEYEETPLGKVFPTIGAHRKNIEAHTGEYLKPQNEVEKFFDDTVDMTTSLLIPAGQANRAGTVAQGSEKVFRSFSKAIGAQLVGKIAKDQGGSEGASEAAKIGSLFFLSLLDKPTAARQVANLYRQAEQSIPQGATGNAIPLQNTLNSLVNRTTQGRPVGNLSTAERFVVNQAENVRNIINNGRFGIQQGWAQLRSINQELQNFLPTLPWAQRRGIRTQATQISGALNDALDQYGATNPAFAQTFRPAQQAFGTLAQSNFVSNWVQNNIKNPRISETLIHLFGGGVAETTASAVLPYKAVQLSYRIINSPTLRGMYQRTMVAATRENAAAFNKGISELNEKVKEEETKDVWEFSD